MIFLPQFPQYWDHIYTFSSCSAMVKITKYIHLSPMWICFRKQTKSPTSKGRMGAQGQFYLPMEDRWRKGSSLGQPSLFSRPGVCRLALPLTALCTSSLSYQLHGALGPSRNDDLRWLSNYSSMGHRRHPVQLPPLTVTLPLCPLADSRASGPTAAESGPSQRQRAMGQRAQNRQHPPSGHGDLEVTVWSQGSC